MGRLSFVVLTLTLLGGCQKKTEKIEAEPSYEKVDNPVTRYAEGLHQDTLKAREAVNKMNEKISQQQENYKKFQELENQGQE